MKKGLKAFLIILGVLLALLVIIGIGGYKMFADEIAAMSTIQELSDDFYYMEYRGDYGFDEFLEQGGGSKDSDIADYMTSFLSKGFASYSVKPTGFACSTVSAKTSDGAHVMGRNFDWDKCKGIIVHTVPDNGYESISTCNLNFIADSADFDPTADMESKMLTLAATYVPLDGMNEKGLCIADLIINGFAPADQNTDKTDLTTTTAIRLILDKAATVDEAVALLEKYDMHSSADMTHHFSVSDATGKSVVIEYVDNEMVVTDTQVVTNHVIAPGEYCGTGLSTTSKARFEKLLSTYEAANGVMSTDDVRDALESVKDDTEWSVVWNSEDLTMSYYHRANFEKPCVCSLGK